MNRSPLIWAAAATLAVVVGIGAWVGLSRPPARIDWVTDYGQALKRARSTDRPVLLYLHTDWCSYCRKMERTTLVDTAVVSEMGSEYVWLKLNAEKDPAGAELRERFQIDSYPAFILLDEQGREIDRLRGYISPDRFALDVRTQLVSPLSLGAVQRRLDSQPDSAQAHFEMGKKRLQRNEFGEAVRHLSKVMDLDPDNQQGLADSGLFFLARALGRVREAQAGLETIEALETRFPDSRHIPDATVLKADLLLAQGQPERAGEALQEFLIRYPDHEYSQRIREFLARRAPAGTPAASH